MTTGLRHDQIHLDSGPSSFFFLLLSLSIFLFGTKDAGGGSWTMLIILTTRIHSNEGTGIKRTYGVTSGVISFYLFHLCFYLLLFCFLLSLSGPRQTGGGEGRRKGEAAGAFSTLCLHLFEQVGE
ncbi:hypothetical protein V8C43DRAFT_319339 [Trichoderma afarasin]